MAYYQNIDSYIKGLMLASADEKNFNESERNAIRGAINLLNVQNGKILEKQKIVGNRIADAKIEMQKYTVFFGRCDGSGVLVEVDYCPDNSITEYYLVGNRPVKLVWQNHNRYYALKYEWETGEFVQGDEYIADIFFSTSDVEQVGEDVFFREVERLHSKNTTHME